MDRRGNLEADQAEGYNGFLSCLSGFGPNSLDTHQHDASALEWTQRHPPAALILIVIKAIFVMGLWFAIAVSNLAAQPRNEFGAWIGVSAGTPTLIHKTERASLFMTGVRYLRTVFQRPAFTLCYTVDVIPGRAQSWTADSAVLPSQAIGDWTVTAEHGR